MIPIRDAKVFTPSENEWEDPIIYISSIEKEAERYGIIKIRPPQSWQPPFCLDFQNCVFQPRYQDLRDVEGLHRLKIAFVGKVEQYWRLQGIRWQCHRHIKGHMVDQFDLHHAVASLGGYEKVCAERIWQQVATKLNFSEASFASRLKQLYTQHLLPFDRFILAQNQTRDAFKSSAKPSEARDREKNLSLNPFSGQKSKSGEQEIDIHSKTKLQTQGNDFPAASFKTLPFQHRQSQIEGGNISDTHPSKYLKLEVTTPAFKATEISVERSRRARGKAQSDTGPNWLPLSHGGYRPPKGEEDKSLGDDSCAECKFGDFAEQLLLCDSCDKGYHTFCLDPPLKRVPAGDWRCPYCLRKEFESPEPTVLNNYGFFQSNNTYTLKAFSDQADGYFRSISSVETSRLSSEDAIETIFWDIVTARKSLEEKLAWVEYGADMPVLDIGSGFPSKYNRLYPQNLNSDTVDAYLQHPWNLVNLPLNKRSMPQALQTEISGVSVPWVYAGMLFTSFCWHTEDLHTASINYNHCGAVKTWYGIPSAFHDAFVQAAQDYAGDLFESAPDILEHLVTLIPPHELASRGVPVYRIHQQPKEFVVTFPKAFHAGFNQGFNVAEAVNFANSNWLSMGRRCFNRYRTICRRPVFAFPELIVALARSISEDSCKGVIRDVLDTARVLHELDRLIESERAILRRLKGWSGNHVNVEADRSIFSTPDDDRVCRVCNTTVALTFVQCQCARSLTCADHIPLTCSCAPNQVSIRTGCSIDSMTSLKDGLHSTIAAFDSWLSNICLFFSKSEKFECMQRPHLCIPATSAVHILDESFCDEHPLSSMLPLPREIIAGPASCSLSCCPGDGLTKSKQIEKKHSILIPAMTDIKFTKLLNNKEIKAGENEVKEWMKTAIDSDSTSNYNWPRIAASCSKTLSDAEAFLNITPSQFQNDYAFCLLKRKIEVTGLLKQECDDLVARGRICTGKQTRRMIHAVNPLTVYELDQFQRKYQSALVLPAAVELQEYIEMSRHICESVHNLLIQTDNQTPADTDVSCMPVFRITDDDISNAHDQLLNLPVQPKSLARAVTTLHFAAQWIRECQQVLQRSMNAKFICKAVIGSSVSRVQHVGNMKPVPVSGYISSHVIPNEALSTLRQTLPNLHEAEQLIEKDGCLDDIAHPYRSCIYENRVENIVSAVKEAISESIEWNMHADVYLQRSPTISELSELMLCLPPLSSPQLYQVVDLWQELKVWMRQASQLLIVPSNVVNKQQQHYHNSVRNDNLAMDHDSHFKVPHTQEKSTALSFDVVEEELLNADNFLRVQIRPGTQFKDIQCLVDKGELLGLDMRREVRVVDGLMQRTRRWLVSVERAFLRTSTGKQSFQQEKHLHRKRIMHAKHTKKKGTRQNKLGLAVSLNTILEHALSMPDLYSIHAIRKQNSGAEEDAEAVFCLCEKNHGGAMVQCACCLYWYHHRCVNYRPSKKHNRYICPVCSFGRRPSINLIVSLVKTGQTSTLNTPELNQLLRLKLKYSTWLKEVGRLWNSAPAAAKKREDALRLAIIGDLMEIDTGPLNQQCPLWPVFFFFFFFFFLTISFLF